MEAGYSKYLTFRAAGQDLAAAATVVRGIIPPGEILLLDRLPRGVLGLAHYRGGMLAVIDLAEVLHIKPYPEKTPRKLVVVEAANGTLAGCLSEKVCDVLEYHARDHREGFLHGQGRRRRLIDFDQLIARIDLTCLAHNV